MKRLVALAGALGILGLAWWFDRLYELSRLQAGRTLDPLLVVGEWVVAQLVLAGLLLVFAWFAIAKNRGSTAIFLVFLLMGLFLVFSFFLTEPLSLLPSFLSQSLAAFLPISPRSMLFQASAFTAIIGLIGLAARRHPLFGK